MFGLLGGLLGRGGGAFASRGGGGLLGGLLAARRARPMTQFSQSGSQATTMPTQRGPVEEPQQQAKPEVQPAQQQTQPQQAQVTPEQAAQPTQPGTQAADAKPQETVTAGLLEEAPAFAPPPEPRGEAITPARQVVNQTEALTPVAQQEDMQFGAVPMPMAPGLTGLLDEGPPRRDFILEDPNPTKPVDTKSQAKYGQGGPQYSYQTQGSSTAFTPRYTYRRS